MAVRLRIRLDLGAAGGIGPGKMRLLRAVRDEGSISAAARSMGMSYRRAWVMVDGMNRMFQEPVVQTRIGGASRGGAHITAFGETLLQDYDALEARASQACNELLAAIDRRAKTKDA